MSYTVAVVVVVGRQVPPQLTPLFPNQTPIYPLCLRQSGTPNEHNEDIKARAHSKI